MDWKDRLELLRWRAVEETDAEGMLLPLAQRAEATRQAGGDPSFLGQRSAWLDRHATGALRSVVDALHVPSLGPWVWGGWLLALGLGYALAELGTDPYQANVSDPTFAGRLINVLALPLMGILLWNAAMIVISLVMEWQSSATTTGLPRLIRRLLLKHGNEGADLKSRVVARFHTLADPLLAARWTSRVRAWLHVGAALLALGTVVGMYANGWSRDFRVVWESTVLDKGTASRLLSALYKPASAVFGVEVPVDQMAAMRAGPGQSPQPQDALPWIHLYAGTLVLLVMLPRLALALLTIWRGNSRVDVVWLRFDWPMHEARLKSSISGTGFMIDVLSLGWRVGEEPRERWSAALREHLGALVLLQFQCLPTDDLEEFVKRWPVAYATTVIVFNAASTPEIEVHSALARELGMAVHQQSASNRLVALLDSKALSERRSEEAVKTRLDLWQTMLRGTVDSVIVA